ncbi:hypothetical protein [Flammeovirga sp. OC4]|uniref:hypothetical protein n=1 Tax=Flammeovirga sp. OC4 TaxID=1382345 RepID=UPI0012E0C157|nr:hypothetical protein [Flammeovirga sp. OC4]
MKNIKKRILSSIALLTLGALIYSCAPTNSASANYFNKERKKYEIMDMHSECPQIVNSRR